MHWNEIGEIWFTLRTSGTSFKSPFWDDFFREYEQLLAMALLSLRQSPPESIFQLLNLILSFPEVINLLWMIIPSIRKPMVFLSMEKSFSLWIVQWLWPKECGGNSRQKWLTTLVWETVGQRTPTGESWESTDRFFGRKLALARCGPVCFFFFSAHKREVKVRKNR